MMAGEKCQVICGELRAKFQSAFSLELQSVLERKAKDAQV